MIGRGRRVRVVAACVRRSAAAAVAGATAEASAGRAARAVARAVVVVITEIAGLRVAFIDDQVNRHFAL